MVRLAVCPGTLPDNDYNSFSAFGFGTWAFDSGMKVFGGIGRSYRVPDARELYFRAAPMKGMPAKLIGNPDLDQTSNTEIDLGLENDWENLYLKAKVFYSWLGDFIFYNDSRMTEKFENMDATLYGFSLNGTWSFTEEVYLDFGLAYQRGKKDDPLSGQSGTDMPKIPPLKGNLALNWEYMPNSLARAELIASDKWSDYDGENGEQELDGWAVLNLNVRHQLTDRIVLIGGIDQASRSRERFWGHRMSQNLSRDRRLACGRRGPRRNSASSKYPLASGWHCSMKPSNGSSGNGATRAGGLIERTEDRHGQPLLIPDLVLDGWWTSLSADTVDAEGLICLYQRRGTFEQFHSEFKTDLDLERLPQGHVI